MKKLFVSVLRYLQYAGLLLGFGCAHVAKSPTAETAIVRSPKVTAVSLSIASGDAPTLAVDEAYVTLTDVQIDRMMAYCERLRTKLYIPEAFDCDDIGREYRVNAQRWARETFGKSCRASLALAEMLVTIEGDLDGVGNYPPGTQHAMVAVQRTDGVWFLIEPAKAKRSRLDAAVFEGVVSVFQGTL